ncbi:uncharacterized protein LOC144369002 isoform X1 [Ictidomys tridecemlineatus]
MVLGSLWGQARCGSQSFLTPRGRFMNLSKLHVAAGSRGPEKTQARGLAGGCWGHVANSSGLALDTGAAASPAHNTGDVHAGGTCWASVVCQACFSGRGGSGDHSCQLSGPCGLGPGGTALLLTKVYGHIHVTWDMVFEVRFGHLAYYSQSEMHSAGSSAGRRGPFSPVWTPSWLERRAEVEITLEPRALTQRSRQRLCSARSSIRNRSDYLLSRLNRTWTQQSIRGPLMKPGCWPPSNGCRGKRPGGRPLRTAHSSRTRPAQAVLHRRGRGLTQHASGGVLSWRPDPNSTALAAAWGPGTEVTASRDEGLSHEAMWELCVRRRGGHCCWKPRSRTVSSS